MGKIVLYIVLAVTLTAGFSAGGQDADPYLKNVLAVQQDDDVYLRWTITAGNTCDGTIIERLNENGAYEKLDEIAGVCGSPDADITYDVTDTTPLPNRVNTYRLLLGLLGYSSPISVEVIILNDEGYSIQPNPVRDRSVFHFENPDGLSYEFCLIDASGKLVMTVKTSEEEVSIDRSLLNSGTYIFKLRRGNTLRSTGKIVVM